MDTITDDKDRRGSSKNLRVHFDIPPKEVDPDTHCQASSTSSSSASSLDFDAIDKLLSNPPIESKHTGLESPGISSPDLSVLSPWSSQNGSATQSPAVQLMGQPAGYDPNRIPISIFSAKPASSPMEWSVASNESLFSIHVGNNSFSRDHFIMFNKSGELLRPDELTGIPATLPSVNEAEHEESKSADDVGKVNSGVTEASDETKKVVLSETPGDDNKERMSSAKIQNYNTISYLSDESNNSGHSFHFPVLAGDGGIYNTTTVNLEMQYPQQQLEQPTQPLNPEKTPKRAGTNWFSCFSCYPQCC